MLLRRGEKIRQYENNNNYPSKAIYLLIQKEMNIQQKQLSLQRHKKLIAMIESYCPTKQQEESLQKIKEDTQFQIAIRYLKSHQNKNYVFPLKYQEQEEDQIEQFPGRVSFQHTFYDLCAQNCIPSKQKIQKQINTARRVKSLGPEKAQENHYKLERVQKPQVKTRLNLPKIQSSKLVFKSLQKRSLHQRQEKKSIKIQSQRNKNTLEIHQTEKNSLELKKLFAKKLLKQQEEVFQIGVTKILANKRIHSPVKAFNKNRKILTEV